MDIAFHYFTVKSLAVLAGFSDDDAQVIAQNSQMVDDFDFTSYWYCTNIPDCIKNNPNYDLRTSIGLFNPAQTGFLCDGLLGKSDYVNLVIPRFQKFTCVPFHFIPPQQSMIGQKEYRVAPATLGDGSLISNMLEQAKCEYRAAADETARHQKLMKIGVLLHIFADTVAHQMFSGYNANVNMVDMVNVYNNSTEKDETNEYRSSVQKFLKFLKTWVPAVTPAIGHMMLEHIPDLTHLSFTMEYKGSDGNQHRYTRSNTSEFLKMAKVILDYLCDCNNSPRYDEDRWKSVHRILQKNFLIDISKDEDQHEMVKHLKAEWQAPHACSYEYDGEALKKAFATQTASRACALADREDGDVPGMDIQLSAGDVDFQPSATDLKMWDEEMIGHGENAAMAANKLFVKASDDFYNFNIIADEVLISLYGPHPRSL